ncbi:MAG: DUF1800 domain-containing protein [Anaerolineales bacterium]|nr:DUF1800 domain-containing protein [Anaerolineales bacterium]
MLRDGGALLLAGAAVAALPDSTPVQAQDQPHRPAMRSPHNPVALDGTAVPPAPAPEIVALTRMGFGMRPGDLASLMALGETSDARIAAYVNQQLNPGAIDDSACDAQLAAQGFTTLEKSLTQLWQDHLRQEGVDWYYRLLPAFETRTATFIRAIYSKRQLVEVLADFWHNHFNVYGFDFWSGTTWVQYDRDVIRGHLFGNFRTMLEAVATSPAMLYYLDNISNTSAGPNENFARELFELHGLGAENYLGVVSDPSTIPVDDEGRPIGYCDEDVYGSTRCFTGWSIDWETGAFAFDDATHDKYSKTVLGVTIPSFQGVKDGRTVLDLIANHPGAARYIARKLCRRLIGDVPPENVVQAAADTFHAQRNAPDQLKQVVRTILLSPEFRTVWGQKIKRPYEFAVGILRATQGDFAPDDSFFWMYQRLGQALFEWHPPNGYPDFKEDWSSTMPTLQRWRLCNWLIDNWRYTDGPRKDKLRIDVDGQMPAKYDTPVAIVNFWAQRILGHALPMDELTPIVEFMAAGRNPDYPLPAQDIADRLRFMVALILMSPSFQWR